MWALLMILLCAPMGMMSLYYATQVGNKIAASDMAGAWECSRKARNFAMIGGIGFAVCALMALGLLVFALQMG